MKVARLTDLGNTEIPGLVERRVFSSFLEHLERMSAGVPSRGSCSHETKAQGSSQAWSCHHHALAV